MIGDNFCVPLRLARLCRKARQAPARAIASPPLSCSERPRKVRGLVLFLGLLSVASTSPHDRLHHDCPCRAGKQPLDHLVESLPMRSLASGGGIVARPTSRWHRHGGWPSRRERQRGAILRQAKRAAPCLLWQRDQQQHGAVCRPSASRPTPLVVAVAKRRRTGWRQRWRRERGWKVRAQAPRQ